MVEVQRPSKEVTDLKNESKYRDLKLVNMVLLIYAIVLMGLLAYFFFTGRLILGIENPFPIDRIGGGTTCIYEGVEYSDGQGFSAGDGCNSCTCIGGRVACSLMDCRGNVIPPTEIIQSCLYNGIEYDEGEGFPADDGCNTCSCTGGEVVCTLIECL